MNSDEELHLPAGGSYLYINEHHYFLFMQTGIMSLLKFISNIKIIVLIESAAYFLSQISTPAYGDLSKKQVIVFQTPQVNVNTYYKFVCFADAPSSVFNETISKTSCALLCMGDSSCRGLNWEEPNTCELFDYVPTRLIVAQNCTYFGPGKITLGLICEISYRCVALKVVVLIVVHQCHAVSHPI